MRIRNRLNVKRVAGITKVGVHADGGGLYLRVRSPARDPGFSSTQYTADDGKWGWAQISTCRLLRPGKKQRARALVLDGTDPQQKRAMGMAAARPVVTFGKFASEWLDSVESGCNNAKHRQQWRRTIDHYAKPLSHLPIKKVTTEAILDVLKPIWLSKAETASRVRSRIEPVIDAARVQGLRDGENPARGRGHLDLLLPKRPKGDSRHHPALPFRETPAFMALLKDRPGVNARALEFTILTAARSGETRGMTWGEVDLEQRLWTVPGARMKAGSKHEVPLSNAAWAILKAIQPTNATAGTVFPAPRGGTMSDMALSQLLKRMDARTSPCTAFDRRFEIGRENLRNSAAKKSKWHSPTRSNPPSSAPTAAVARLRSVAK